MNKSELRPVGTVFVKRYENSSTTSLAQWYEITYQVAEHLCVRTEDGRRELAERWEPLEMRGLRRDGEDVVVVERIVSQGYGGKYAQEGKD
jgi:hypothetical protein